MNPDHMEPVSSRENTLRGETLQAANKAKTHCIHGHELSVDNLYVDPKGWRHCRTCQAEQKRRYKAKKKKGANPANGVDARVPKGENNGQ